MCRGLASYPSSVLMNAIPAKVAGVGHITMVVPAPNGELNPLVLAAAHLSGVDSVITIGGGLRQWQHWHMVQTVLPK